MSTGRGTDKGDVARVYNGTLLSRKEERSHVTCSNTAATRDYPTEGSKSERERHNI